MTIVVTYDGSAVPWVPSVKDGSIDLSTSLQAAIDALTTGGVLEIPVGTYMVNNVYVTSGITLRIASGTIFVAPVGAPANSNLFLLSTKSNTSTTYATDLGLIGGPWVIDISPPGSASNHCAMRVVNAQRFVIENLHIICGGANTGALVLAPNNSWLNNTTGLPPLIPREGIIRNVSSDGNVRGGGTIQNGSGVDIRFERISSVGGVALRFETDQTPGGTAYGLIENNSGDTISCDLGNDALHFAAHTQTIKNISVTRVRATGCETGVYFGPISTSTFSDVTIDGVHVDGTGAVATNPTTSKNEGIFVDSASPLYVNRCVVRAARVENISGTAFWQSGGLKFEDCSYTAAATGGFPAIQSVASAATITLPTNVPLVAISGTTTITSITAGPTGQVVILQFAGVLTLTDGSNLKLAGNYVTTADDTITLVSDGTNWIETARSVN